MVQTNLPNWVKTRYELLWKELGDREFGMEDVEKILKDKDVEKQSMQGIPVLISELKKAGWLEVKLDPDDSRKRIYNLKSFDQVMGEAFQKISRGDLEGILKKAADLIRTRVDYKFILILLFLKRISDKWELEYEKAYKEAIDDGFSEAEAKKEATNETYHDFVIPEKYLWENIRKDVNSLPENFSKGLKILAEKNPELKDILDTTDFIQFTNNRENAEILRQLVELFSERKLHHVAPDILGDAYEWVLGYFAPQKAKEGEVYTPREVIRLLVEILDPKPNESVYDPAVASSGMLIIAHQYVEEKYGREDAEKLFLFGQEANHKTLAFGKMNLYMHEIRNAQLAYGDTLLYPKFKEEDMVNQFDMVIANPPWNQDGYDENVIKKGDFWKKRFTYGFATKQSADWIWIQHMLASSKGKVGVVIDNGCLFRGGAEKIIRTKIVDEDLIECVMLLPEKLFYNTGAPGAIMILNKKKSKERKGKVLFINATNEYGQHPDVRKLKILGKEHIGNIAEAYKDFKEKDGFARSVELVEIKENEYNLNVSLYVFPEDEIEEIDIKEEWGKYKKLKSEIDALEEDIETVINNIK
ncbi:MAG: class I SAM-dependent DNA methyltransferase [Candidatus Omnitrophica bacterium]|nr:class I SAM-dependent DNA methyltransferase [Candidatus Omnitrophota bacterium]MDD5488305.1 class I SAM-dependent DNA methyltransferase [Candidatus Omnitrophota bacterium]